MSSQSSRPWVEKELEDPISIPGVSEEPLLRRWLCKRRSGQAPLIELVRGLIICEQLSQVSSRRLQRMKVWTADKKFMWYGTSGFHYQANFLCSRSRDVAAERVKAFYVARRGVFSEPSAEGHMRFSRGRRPWSWFMPSETSQPQVVDITLSPQAQATNVAIDYHVTSHFGLVVPPCMFDREIAKLREELEKQ
jgi:hypothetical protein